MGTNTLTVKEFKGRKDHKDYINRGTMWKINSYKKHIRKDIC